MAFRRPGGLRTSMTSRQATFNPKSYTKQDSGTRRHQFMSAPSAPAAGAGIVAPNEYLVFNPLKFRRTFSIGVTDDVEPTPTASNNYQSQAVMNGSKITNFSAKIKVQNVSSTNSAIWDIYEVALSFYDVLIWDTVGAAIAPCPFTFDTTTVAPGDNRGEISIKTIVATTIVTNTYKNFKFLQHYMKYKGSLTLTPTDGGQPNAEININRLPPKVRRSQTGMFYAIILHNDSGKNDANTLNQDVSMDVNFMETPSDHRLPYID